ncbi:GNAT family N-acetyltransferase [Kibdelosporangium philippinense]|uniref:GNAT family N-acetyltransferase n=1 Tax=Kibdelosporangium philippinense TaxID=211113 RepID=A0ABS8Z7L4_9PSEU|nr:GNAT family N-acetyltransferase [Kibdelosporangium philippinense]MCE7003043.1 GNAT family N-acetyltransferase [Kibdelosporangium philippinense]
MTKTKSGALKVKDLTKATWNDFESVMGSNGGASGCWCMHWRLSIAEFMEQKGDGNKKSMKRLSQRKQPPGVVIYEDDDPVAWCSLGPRGDFSRLERSPLLKEVDDTPVCSIACIYVEKKHRKSGLMPAILDAVCDYAAAHGYTTVEGYPIEPAKGKKAGPDSVMTGVASAFVKAGFDEVSRPRKDRPIMRRTVS